MSRLSSPCNISRKREDFKLSLGTAGNFLFLEGPMGQMKPDSCCPIPADKAGAPQSSDIRRGQPAFSVVLPGEEPSRLKLQKSLEHFLPSPQVTAALVGIETRERTELLPGGLPGFLPLICKETRGPCPSFCSFTPVAALVLLHESKAGMQAVPLVHG